MAEYIDKQAVLNDMIHYLGIKSKDYLLPAERALYKRVEQAPAADVRPVVLCRDCKHKGWVQEPEHGKSVDYCRLIERCVDKQFFCAAGERKTNCGADMR